MGVYIKGLQMPKNMKFKAVVYLSAETAYVHTDEMGGGVFETCKAFSVPDHGDLIDRDELMKHGVYMPQDGGYLPLVYMSYVKGAKAVIPAERSEE